MNNQPRFSVIVPTHDGEARLHESLGSVTSQTFTDYELIVVCDACTDRSGEVAKEYGATVLYVNCGRDGLARNAGIDHATGEWILFLDDDDHFLHEYCFEQLNKTISRLENEKPDAIDFAFVWKEKRYCVPSPKESFVMVWARAWRRSFIGNNRMDDTQYGADANFFERMILHNPDAKIYYWNFPMYYYNYMRKGSMSQVHYDEQAYLDIIITHNNEPWECGRPMFDMIQHQQCADMSKVHVVLVQDGERNGLDWESLFAQYSYRIDVVTIPHSGPAAARNAGLEHSNGQWVMFCNFDDMIADVAALNLILENIPNDDYDIIWGKYAQKTVWVTGHTYINCTDECNLVNCDNKMYRRKFLDEHLVRFIPESGVHYDYVFNTIALAESEQWRVGTLTTVDYLYFKSFSKNSYRHTVNGHMAMITSRAERDMLLVHEMDKRGKNDEYIRAVVRVMLDYYFDIYDPDVESKPVTMTPGAARFYHKHRDIIDNISDSDLEVLTEFAQTELFSRIQMIYNEHRLEYYLVNDDISFRDWLKLADGTQENGIPEEQNNTYTDNGDSAEPIQAEANVSDPRIVVYCGTRNVYPNMIASVKSLLATTPVDHVYFLIEDDAFPEQLPDIITTINVSGQNVFPPDGPNFSNAWTYMCMMRATFPTLFSQYSRILSLDIDIVINDNVSDLWNYDMTDYYLAGVAEPQRQKKPDDPLYVNFGVVMMNLDKMRQDGIQQKVVDALNAKKIDCPEQGAFNQACAGHILALPNDYNCTVYSHITGKPERERILHYAGQRYWKHYRNVKAYSDLTWSDVMTKQNELKG